MTNNKSREGSVFNDTETFFFQDLYDLFFFYN